MNNVSLIGRITKDIELKQSASGTSFCSLTLAVNRQYKKEGQPDADFISCKVFGKTAETIAKYCDKGRQIGVTGRIQTGSYDNKDGNKVYTTDIMIENFYFADSKKCGQDENIEAEPASNDELPF